MNWNTVISVYISKQNIRIPVQCFYNEALKRNGYWNTLCDELLFPMAVASAFNFFRFFII